MAESQIRTKSIINSYKMTLKEAFTLKIKIQWQDSEDAVELAPAKEEVALIEKEPIECLVEELVYKQLIP